MADEKERERTCVDERRVPHHEVGTWYACAVPDFAWSDLLPFGFLMFAGTLFGLTRRKAGRALSRRDLPRLAARLGLAYQVSDSTKGGGRIVGEVQGVLVRIESDDRARIVCQLPRDLGVDVRSYAHYKRVPGGYERVSLGSRSDDEWMQVRLLHESGEESFERVRERLISLLDALRPHRSRLKEFTLDASRVECVFDFGTPPYLPASLVERILPPMLSLASSESERRAQDGRRVQ